MNRQLIRSEDTQKTQQRGIYEVLGAKMQLKRCEHVLKQMSSVHKKSFALLSVKQIWTGGLTGEFGQSCWSVENSWVKLF